MSTPVTETAEFYHQLRLLVRADLPLPDCLLQVGRHVRRRSFRKAVVSIGERTAQGESFGELLQEYPQHFSRFHAQLLRLGEESGTLPEMLDVVARFARYQQLIGTSLREAIAYPLLVSHVACIAFLITCVSLAPQLLDFMQDLPQASDDLYGEVSGSPPWLTLQILQFCGVVADHRDLMLGLYAVFACYSVWLFLPFPASRRAVLHVARLLPGSWRIAHSATSARICSMWGTFIERGVPAPESLDLVAHLTDHGGTTRALSQAAEDVRGGADIADALEGQPLLDRLITLAFRHTPEDRLAEELVKLGELFDQRVALASRAVARAWIVWAFLGCCLLVGGVTIAVFLPFYQFLQWINLVNYL